MAASAGGASESGKTAVVALTVAATRNIVFSSNRDGNSEVYAMNADGTGQTNLTNNATFDYWLSVR